MAPDASGGLRNSSPSSSSSSAVKSKHGLKKGPWTTSEDMILIEYVKKHGEGNWNAVQRNSGLMRCGKSCRLRWANHLRPNLKKGAFSPEEEKLIVELHSKLGNKWARMASQLPGRTDNEIKNYWNTRLKRRQRAGLPIYPQEVAKQEQLNTSLTPSSLSSLFVSSQPTNPNFYVSPPQNQPNTPYINHQLKLYRGENGGLALSLAASNSSFSSSVLSAAPFLNQGLSNPLPISSLVQYNSLNYGVNSSMEMGVIGLPSIQSTAVTPAASSSDQDYEVETAFSRRNNSGLLQDLIEESQVLEYHEKTEENPFNAATGNLHEKADFGFGTHGNENSDNNYEETNVAGEGITSMDDDLLNLLDNFPLSVPIPDWNEGHGNESPILTDGTNRTIESQPEVSEYNPVATSSATANQEWNFGSCLWNNMPSIY